MRDFIFSSSSEFIVFEPRIHDVLLFPLFCFLSTCCGPGIGKAWTRWSFQLHQGDKLQACSSSDECALQIIVNAMEKRTGCIREKDKGA